VAASAAAPSVAEWCGQAAPRGLATGPLVVLAATAILGVSLVATRRRNEPPRLESAPPSRHGTDGAAGRAG